MLFDAPLIAGLALREEFVSQAEEAALIDAIGGVELSPFRFQGFTGKRLTHSFGWRYDFDNGRFAETEPIPDWLLPLRDRAADFADDLVQALLIRYDPGAGIGWHRDRPVFDQVVGISLGAEAVLTFRQRTAAGFRRVKVPLPPRCAYHLDGEVRRDWEHGIASHDALRYSVTFRSLSEQGRRKGRGE
jgi:alkylated DNA repair protein (DNA oxidative demethylase)